MKDSAPARLLDPNSPTAPKLRALLARLVPGDISEEAEERLEARIQDTLAADAASAPEESAPLRSVK